MVFSRLNALRLTKFVQTEHFLAVVARITETLRAQEVYRCFVTFLFLYFTVSYFQAILRMGRDVDIKEKERKVNKILREVGFIS